MVLTPRARTRGLGDGLVAFYGVDSSCSYSRVRGRPGCVVRMPVATVRIDSYSFETGLLRFSMESKLREVKRR
jgi:hypothetical protein